MPDSTADETRATLPLLVGPVSPVAPGGPGGIPVDGVRLVGFDADSLDDGLAGGEFLAAVLLPGLSPGRWPELRPTIVAPATLWGGRRHRLRLEVPPWAGIDESPGAIDWSDADIERLAGEARSGPAVPLRPGHLLSLKVLIALELAALAGGPGQAVSDGLVGELRAATRTAPASAAWPNALGAFAALAGDAVSASAWFEDALGRDPFCPVSRVNLICLLRETGRAAESRAEALRGIDRFREGGPPSSLCADPVLWSMADSEFGRAWEAAARFGPGQSAAEAADKRGLVLWFLHLSAAGPGGEPGHFYEAALLRPGSAPTLAALGASLARAGRYADAAPHLELALSLDPGDDAARRVLAGVREALGRPTGILIDDRIDGGEDGNHGAVAPMRIAWDGDLGAAHSLGKTGDVIASALRGRGHEVGPRAATDAPTATISLRWPPPWQPPASGLWVVFQPWEWSETPQTWPEQFRGADEVWVPSHSCRDAFVAGGFAPERVAVVPLGADPDTYRPDGARADLTTDKPFRFLWVGGTVERKGFDLVLNAYASAFSADDPVCLVVKEHGADTSYLGRTAGDWVRDFRSTPGRPEILYLEEHLSEEGLAALYRACDCLVAPYRGEGFSLPALEAMACGLPVVHTAGGPVPEFCGPDCGWPVPATLFHVARSSFGPFAPARDPSGFEPDPASLRAAMRDAFERPDEARRRGCNAALAVRSMTWVRSAAGGEARLAALVAGIAAGAVPRRFVRPVRTAPYRPTVSLTMIVRDEEENIRDCLESAAGLFDQVVVVDTGSRDRTPEIAAGMGAEVYRTDWPDHFALARNAALDRATGEWVFWLDADDRLPDAAREALKGLFAGLEDEDTAWAMKCRCVSSAAGGEVVVDHVRLFRNDPRVRWRYRVHEQILPSVRAAGGSVRWLPAEIVHLGYRDPAARRGKLERDIRLLSMEALERPGDPFSLFNAAQVLHELGRVGEAAAAYRASLAGSDPRDSIVRKARAGLTQCLRDLGRTADALAECRAGREAYPDDAELLFAEAILARDLGDAEGSISLLDELASGTEGPHFASVDPGLRTTRARHELAVGLWGLGRKEEAVGNWEAAVGHNPRFLPAWAGLAGALLAAGAGGEGRAGAALAAMRALPEPGPTEADALESSSLSASGRHREAAAMLSGAAARDPRSGAIRRLLGIALLAAGDVVRARAELLEALRLDPTDREAFEAVRGLGD